MTSSKFYVVRKGEQFDVIESATAPADYAEVCDNYDEALDVANECFDQWQEHLEYLDNQD